MTKNKYLRLALIIFTLILCGLGLVFIYSASSYNGEVNYSDSFFFVKKQAVGLVLGVVSMVLISRFNYNKLIKLRWWVIGISVALLVLVFVPFISINANGARRWIGFGPLSIQSSEVAKFGFVIFASAYMSMNYKKMKTFKGITPVILAGGLICLLILAEPNLSVTLCVGMVMLLMLLIGGIRIKHFLFLLIPAFALVPILIIIEPYRFNRLVAFINPWANPLSEGFQLIQSLYSLGAGGLFGLGLFNSRQKYLFLPFSESDFIFSIIGEELGFFGAICLLGIYLAVIIIGYKIALSAKDRFGAYLAFGITSVISCQLLINVAVVTGSIPPTGIPLPFISFGGSSLVVFLSAIGILLNISKQADLNYDNAMQTSKTFDFESILNIKTKKTKKENV